MHPHDVGHTPDFLYQSGGIFPGGGILRGGNAGGVNSGGHVLVLHIVHCNIVKW